MRDKTPSQLQLPTTIGQNSSSTHDIIEGVPNPAITESYINICTYMYRDRDIDFIKWPTPESDKVLNHLQSIECGT